MAGNRIGYLAALTAAFLCQVFDVGYLAHFVFLLTLLLPLAGLAVSLPAMLRCRVRLSAAASLVRRGEPVEWTLTMTSPGRLPVARVSGRLRAEQRMSGERWTCRVSQRGPEWGRAVSRACPTTRCGLWVCRAERLWVCDCLGLFALPLRRPQPVEVLVCPCPEDPGPLHLPEGTGVPVPLVPRGKAPVGEDYELRPYRPGDNVRTIHWKASMKRDDLVVREPLELRRPLPVLVFDHFGPPDQMERMLDRLAGWSAALLAEHRPHQVWWAHPRTGEVRRWPVDDGESWRRCLRAVLSDPAPGQGRSVGERPIRGGESGELFPIRITGEEGRGDGT